jgi:anti-anti-sigma factor
MRVNYRVDETEAGTIISVFDDIDLANANLLADTLFSLIDTRRDIVVDFRGLRYIDSVGLHILLRAGQRAERLGCDVTVVAVRPIRQLVEQIGLGRLMSIVSDIPPSHQAPRAAAPPAAASHAVRPKTPEPKPGAQKKSTEPSRTES